MNTDDLNIYNYLNSLNGKEKLYIVPQGYFDTLCDRILTNIKLYSVKRKETFTVSSDYFTGFSSVVLSKIRAVEQDFESETPLLNSISKENVYSIPDNYFKSFAPNLPVSEIEDNAQVKSEAKIISLMPKHRSRMMGVAAAVISLIVLGAGFIWENNNAHTKVKTSYAGVIKSDLSSLSDQDIADYLDSPDGAAVEEDINESTDSQTKSELKTLSGDEMESYLSQTPATY